MIASVLLSRGISIHTPYGIYEPTVNRLDSRLLQVLLKGRGSKGVAKFVSLLIVLAIFGSAVTIATYASDPCAIYCTWFGTEPVPVNVKTIVCNLANNDSREVSCMFEMVNTSQDGIRVSNATFTNDNSTLAVLTAPNFYLGGSETGNLTLAFQVPSTASITVGAVMGYSIWLNSGQQIAGWERIS